MKYIRTTDNIFRIDNDKISVINGCLFASIRGGILHAIKVKDKVADTIEELCDEFVWDNCLIVFTNKDKTQFVLKQAKAEHEEEYDINKDFDEDSSPIYGAIWTDKGLIYVAKMNDKGELELL